MRRLPAPPALPALPISAAAACLALLASTALTLAGCASADPVSAAQVRQTERLQHGEWVVAGVDGKPWAAGSGGPATLRFSPGGNLGGQAGCNRFMGRYHVLADRLSTETLVPAVERQQGPLASTRMACAPDLAAAERHLLGVLERVSGFSVAGDDTLRLEAPGGHVIEARRP